MARVFFPPALGPRQASEELLVRVFAGTSDQVEDGCATFGDFTMPKTVPSCIWQEQYVDTPQTQWALFMELKPKELV